MPYPGMHANEVYQLLLNGKRMDPPMYCPEEICKVMSKCWNEYPKDRPNFENLKEMLWEILGCEEITQVLQQNEKSVDTLNSPKESDSVNGQDDYLNGPFPETVEMGPI
ncbi:Fibroblast growth factor receptor 3 [Paramuricea clavata]|uniref:Fibroblast growth factor receptor 3 n=1 Tax=Paramuricea clavata TaxID=317549 RepID=A0A7D9DM40_PARCT|nr:Fibroblast growth factor receptor 3 [Paramuricea clavata]